MCCVFSREIQNESDTDDSAYDSEVWLDVDLTEICHATQHGSGFYQLVDGRDDPIYTDVSDETLNLERAEKEQRIEKRESDRAAKKQKAKEKKKRKRKKMVNKPHDGMLMVYCTFIIHYWFCLDLMDDVPSPPNMDNLDDVEEQDGVEEEDIVGGGDGVEDEEEEEE